AVGVRRGRVHGADVRERGERTAATTDEVGGLTLELRREKARTAVGPRERHGHVAADVVAVAIADGAGRRGRVVDEGARGDGRVVRQVAPRDDVARAAGRASG